MGNNLCKERVDRAQHSKSPVDRVINRCSQVLPNRHKDKNTNWHKHVLETCPPLTTEPKATNLNEWRNVTLRPVDNAVAAAAAAAPVISVINVTKPNPVVSFTNDDATLLAAVPIAPPRRKRNSSTLKPGCSQPGGFEDVFGHLQRRASVDSAFGPEHRASMVLHGSKRFSSNYNVARETSEAWHSRPTKTNDDDDLGAADFESSSSRQRPVLQRKISKVGNKKSDKFFGENLSDCLSDERIDVVGTDDLDAFVASNVVSTNVVSSLPPRPPDSAPPAKENVIEARSSSSLDRKAEFLMAMLENHNLEEMRYLSQTPVEEPIIVPKRKHGRHICDDDEKLKLAFGDDEKRRVEDEVDALHGKVTNTEGHHHSHDGLHAAAADIDRTSANHVDHVHTAAATTIPKKPDRDFSKYAGPKKPTPVAADGYSHLTSEIITVERPTRRKSAGLSRDKLPKPPPTPDQRTTSQSMVALEKSTTKPSDNENAIRLNGNNTEQRQFSAHHRQSSEPHIVAGAGSDRRPALPTGGAPSEELIINNNSENNTSDISGLTSDDKLDTMLKKCSSSQSFLTPDLMDQIVNKVYGFKINWDDHENANDNNYDDGSAQVEPTSKLKTRKISVIRNKEPMEKPIEEESAVEDAVPKPSFSIGESKVQLSEKIGGDAQPATATSLDAVDPPKEIATALVTDILTAATDSISNALQSNTEIQSVVSKVPDTIVAELVSPEKSETLLIKRTDTVIELQQCPVVPDSSESVLDSIYVKHQSILNEFQKNLDVSVSKQNHDKIIVDHTEDVECEDRHSNIDQHDQWFNEHTGVAKEDQPIRREPVPLPSYDTRKLFPFGLRDDDIGSKEFFVNDPVSQSSSCEQLNGDEVLAMVRDMKQLTKPDPIITTTTTNDHSTLLKYLEKPKSEQ